MTQESGIQAPRVCLCTLGCAKNEVDSEMMERRLRNAGFSIVQEPACADAIIVNTCSFIQTATEESIDAIFEALALPSVAEGSCAVIIAGCMPARYGEEVLDAFDEPVHFMPCSEEDDVVNIVQNALKDINISFHEDAQASCEEEIFRPPYSYVKISDGCDRFCSYCTIPHIRGRYHSFAYDDISSEVARSIGEGAREIVLIAQDTGRWGTDLPEKRTLAWLLDRLASVHPDTWFRVMYIQPDGITDELLDVMASHQNIASYLDIPLQHVNATILHRMNRHPLAGGIEAFVAHLRGRVSDLTLRTTLIAGFPGETDEQFDELLAFSESGLFDYIGVFPYSPEEGTASASLEPQIDEDERIRRASRIQEAATMASAALISERVGEICEVLVEGVDEDGHLFGRTMQQAPDVDGITFIDEGIPGERRRALIEDTLLYDMEASAL